MSAPVYVRDLTESMQKSFIRGWEDEVKSTDAKRREHGNAMLKAVADGEDIKVGTYCANGREKVD